MNGLDALGIISSQDSDILTDLIDAESMSNVKLAPNKRKLDDIVKDVIKDVDDTVIESQSHDHDRQACKKASLPAPEIRLSSLSFKAKPRESKPKTIYKLILPSNKPNITGNITKNSKSKKGLDLRVPSQRVPITSKERNPLPKRGRKKKYLENSTLSSSLPSDSHGIFSGLNILYIRNDIDTVRLDLMKEKVKAKGGKIVDSFDSNVTHVITSLPRKNVHDALGLINKKCLEGVFVLQPNWISMSITYNKLADVNFYVVPLSEESDLKESKGSSNSPTTGAKRTRDNVVDEDSENKRIKKQTLSLTPERDRSPSLSQESSSDSLTLLPTIPPSSTENTHMISDYNDPLLEMIREAKHLTEEGLYLDEEKDEGIEFLRGRLLENEGSMLLSQNELIGNNDVDFDSS
ncbi:4672_t:CDS:2 [Acaulospora morrowiae]|uniref:4672_t:CDS:1 n=1 Tax=Acaulospora morrowiae TaxID=94023 RepID=A0A9N9BEX1_9GLOM|nr:4672_t:CDS:2 [Acaulospora morrowiae]